MAVLSSTLQAPALDVAMGRAQLDPRRCWLSLLDRYDSRKGESADAVWTRLNHRRLRLGVSVSDLIHYFEDEFAEITAITREEPRGDETQRILRSALEGSQSFQEFIYLHWRPSNPLRWGNTVRELESYSRVIGLESRPRDKPRKTRALTAQVRERPTLLEVQEGHFKREYPQGSLLQRVWCESNFALSRVTSWSTAAAPTTFVTSGDISTFTRKSN
ncbi:hypothetical protein NDN08_007711 [Rhodosorus marinus]|uniref:Uncharacterized protein n=1 Tax=Rhodosorus marinus TaxID=101924 RepID=A0AAV8V3T6_9RHOD|nr:hypothetical protein NDN08_007711 [Rhodosorus marinus]